MRPGKRACILRERVSKRQLHRGADLVCHLAVCTGAYVGCGEDPQHFPAARHLPGAWDDCLDPLSFAGAVELVDCVADLCRVRVDRACDEPLIYKRSLSCRGQECPLCLMKLLV